MARNGYEYRDRVFSRKYICDCIAATPKAGSYAIVSHYGFMINESQQLWIEMHVNVTVRYSLLTYHYVIAMQLRQYHIGIMDTNLARMVFLPRVLRHSPVHSP